MKADPRLAIFAAALAAAGCRKKADPAAAARDFFAQVAADQTGAAFADASFIFRAQQSEQAFTAAARDLGLIGAPGVNIESVVSERGLARIELGLGRKRGPAVPLIVLLRWESGAWRVCTIKSPMNLETGIAENRFTPIGKTTGVNNPFAQSMPDVPKIRAMARETLLQFHDAIRQKSFEDFYDNVSPSWQRQLTLGMLTRTFQGFIDQQPDLAGIRDSEVTLDEPPYIDSEGLLVVAGSYPTKPLRLVFALKYYYDLPNWRAFGLQVDLFK